MLMAITFCISHHHFLFLLVFFYVNVCQCYEVSMYYYPRGFYYAECKNSIEKMQYARRKNERKKIERNIDRKKKRRKKREKEGRKKARKEEGRKR